MSGQNRTATADKTALRERARAARAGLSPRERAAGSARIAAHCLRHPLVAAARTVFVYVSHADEVATHALIDHLITPGRTVVVPLIADRETMLAVAFPGWSALRPGALGILSPPPGPAFEGPVDVALVPGLAFTPEGGRLGYGGGYYDRWLATHPRTRALGIAFRAQLIRSLPLTATDVPMNGLITEEGLVPGPGKV